MNTTTFRYLFSNIKREFNAVQTEITFSPHALSLDNHQFIIFLTSFTLSCTHGGEISDDNSNMLRINEIK